MGRKLVLWLAVTSVLCAVARIAGRQVPNVAAQEGQTALTAPSPAQGYTVHVLAPHVVDGHSMGP